MYVCVNMQKKNEIKYNKTKKFSNTHTRRSLNGRGKCSVNYSN